MILKKSKIKKEKDTTELAVQKKVLTPEQKKKRKRRIIVGVAAVAVAGFAVSRALTPAALPTVMVRAVQVGDIEQTVDASGTVTTEESKTYFSPVGAKVSECKVQAGDAVAAGDVMLVYDAQDLEEKQKEAELQNNEAKYTYENTVGKSNKDASEYSRSSHDVEILEQQVEDWKAEVHALKQYITDMGCFLREAQNKGHENDAEEYQNKIDQATNTLAVKEEELADFQSNLSEQKGIKNSTEDSMLTASGKKQVEATKDLAALKASQVTDAVAEVKDGLKADFNGVVTDVKAVNGGAVEENGELLTVDSTENVCVKVSLNKSDLEKVKEGQKAAVTIVGKQYEGTVARISRSATKNEKGAALVTAEIHIDNPDQDMYLGVDGKATIEGNKVENVVMVPIEAVNIGKDGSFVYIVNDDGIIETRMITTGLSSAEETEVREGLDGTEQVVLSVDAGIEEGMQVTPVEG